MMRSFPMLVQYGHIRSGSLVRMQVVFDVHERRSPVPNEVARLGILTSEQKLWAGDYSVGEALIERKTVADLHLTVQQGRFWAQIGRLRSATRWPYLLIEGESLYARGLSRPATRGVLLALSDLGVSIVRSQDAVDSARWIQSIGSRRISVRARDRPVYAQRPQRDPRVSPPEQALAAAPGVSVVTARALLERFGNLRNVILASEAELVEVNGVGAYRARAITSLATNH